MKFTINTQDFKVAIDKAVKVIPAKPSLKILGGVNIIVENDTCTLHATDLETTIVSKIPTNKMETGTINFILDDVKNIQKAMKFFKSDNITFSIDDITLTIASGDKKISQNIKIETGENNIFPALNEMVADKKYTYNIDDLKRRFNLIKYAVSKTDIKPILQGIHFNNGDMVACDSWRLAINKDISLNIDTPITILANSLKIATDILQGNIKIETNNKYISISDNNTTVIARLIDGDYIPYKKYIPEEKSSVEMNVENFMENMKYLKTFTSKKSLNAIQWFEDKLKMRTEKGIYETTIDVISNLDAVIGFNCDYMIDALSQFKGKATICLNSRTHPILIKQEENIAIVMPININHEINCFKNEMSA